jgi:hypothetical protein
LRNWECPACHTETGIAQSYYQCVGLFTLASGGLIGVGTHQSTSGGSWLLGVIVSTIMCWFFFLAVIPPWLKRGRNQARISLLHTWVSAAISAFLFQFLGLGIALLLLGASHQELMDHIEFLSVPLAWISPNFLLTPANSFFDLCGILLGNSVFYGTFVFACYQPVRWAFRRARPTQLSLSNRNSPEDEE